MPSFMRMGRRHSDSGTAAQSGDWGDFCLDFSPGQAERICTIQQSSINRATQSLEEGFDDDSPVPTERRIRDLAHLILTEDGVHTNKVHSSTADSRNANSPNVKQNSAKMPTALAQAEAASQKTEAASSTLASRRGMALNTIAPTKPSLSPKAVANKKREIERIQDGHFRDLYKLGDEVMSSCHEGMEVLFARRLSDNAQVVIKIRKKATSFASDSEEQEWRATMVLMLNLPPRESICRLFEVLQDSKCYYVVMEKVEGKDLFELQDHPGPWPISDAREVIGQLLEAVCHLHSKGYIHKDLKLENVMIDSPPGTPKKGSPKNSTAHPMDPNSFFGLAPATSGAGDESPKVKLIDFDTVEECTPQSPKAKVVLGSDQYIAPEAYSGRYSSASDMFAVGVIAYKLVAGRFPFPNRFFDDKPGENWVGSPKMKQIKQRLCNYNVDYTLPAFSKEPDALDFCRSLLDCDVSRRMEAPQALAHPFITRGATTSTPSKSMAFGSAPSIGSSSQNPFSIAAMARLFPRMAQS
eukprot:gnl/TRDRNA2_/TRDRNA2_175423_c6_seq7.p1 gnl/TRDRNA2_/TRDRNA2_175423_c6~~gnl/TRDRNA2_/TRDRNA2_175423_c6_seq7.p1  ORF type:complete len:562 (+),score=93.24 gnl/TRDRNA2_/TRDRNA2_175423_c6_seq7:113-1687(+)